MAFFTNLVALTWYHDEYAVHSKIWADIDKKLLDERKLLNDVSASPGYLDYMAVLARRQLEEYLLKDSDSRSAAARDWYNALPEDVQFILVHRGEWESGL